MSASITYTFSPSTQIRSSEVNQDMADLIAAINVAAPAGIIVAWSKAISLIPAGWYICDGFNLTPNLIGKFIRGAGAGYAVNAEGGTAVETLTVAQIPGHTHWLRTGTESADHIHYDAGHAHTVRGTAGWSYKIKSALDGGWSTVNQQGDNDTMASQSGYANIGGRSASHYHDATTDAGTGGGGSHNNLPPFMNLAFIMKS